MDRGELAVMLQKLGMGTEGSGHKKWLDEVFEAADTNHDGVVSFSEFVALFMSTSRLSTKKK